MNSIPRTPESTAAACALAACACKRCHRRSATTRTGSTWQGWQAHGSSSRLGVVSMGRLEGKSCVVTGAALGIGGATARRFAAEGARLTLTDIQADPLAAIADELRARGAEVETVVGDVSIEDDARRMIRAAVDRFGG